MKVETKMSMWQDQRLILRLTQSHRDQKRILGVTSL